jgi:3-methyladenine DNA glycosylase AlkD
MPCEPALNDMTAKDIVAEMKKLANPAAKKNWINNGGAKEPCLGVKVADMKTIQKRVKTDYPLALELYDTGIADAMYLAGYITNDAKMTPKDLQKWIEAATSDWVSDYMVPWVASASPHGRELALKWMDSKIETIAAAGWQTYGSIVAIKPDADLDLAEIKALLQRVAKAIHQQPDRLKWAMNNFVIAIGSYVKPLHQLAIETATSIGKLTAAQPTKCGTIPYAPERIQQFAARSPIGKKRKSAKC